MRTEEEAASGSDSEADWVAEASPPSPSSVDEDEGEEQADHEGEGEEFVFGRSAVPDDGRLFASIDSWRRTMNSIGELQEMLDESGMEPALRHVHSAEEALRAVLAALEQNARTGRAFYEDAVARAAAGQAAPPAPDPPPDPLPDPHAVDTPHQALVCKILDDAQDMSFVCPIGLVAMQDPCVAADGITYDRANIAQALRVRLSSPISRRLLTTDRVFPNVLVRTLMLERALRLATHEQSLLLLRL